MAHIVKPNTNDYSREERDAALRWLKWRELEAKARERAQWQALARDAALTEEVDQIVRKVA